jgi:hypothetical protein
MAEEIKKPKKNYVDGASLHKQILRYQEIDGDDGEWIFKSKNKNTAWVDSKKRFYTENNARRAALTKDELEAEEKERKELMEVIGDRFLKIIKGRMQTYQFNRYDDNIKRELTQNAFLTMISKIRNYKREKLPQDANEPNSFAFFTQIAYIELLSSLRGYYANKNQNVSLTFVADFDDRWD